MGSEMKQDLVKVIEESDLTDDAYEYILGRVKFAITKCQASLTARQSEKPKYPKKIEDKTKPRLG